jgi:hypothetical protein
MLPDLALIGIDLSKRLEFSCSKRFGIKMHHSFVSPWKACLDRIIGVLGKS